MAVRNSRSAVSDHRRHDRLLIARFAAGDAEFGQEHEAQHVIRQCSECAALARDIRSISRAVGELPVPVRPRDFRLSTQDADKLRGSRLERWLRSLSGSGWTVVRPVAGVALSIGLVMSVVGALPMIGAAVPAAGPTNFADDGRNEAFPPTTAAGGPVAPGETADLNGQSGSGEPGRAVAENPFDQAYLNEVSPAPQPAPGKNQVAPSTAGSGPSPRDLLFVGGLGVSALAVLILALFYAARRRFTDPLLR